MWFDADHNSVTDDFLYEKIILLCNNGYKLFVGTDSDLFKLDFRFATVVCLYKQGAGGIYYYKITNIPKATFLKRKKERIFCETELSLEIAHSLFDNLSLNSIIHLDVSEEGLGHFTSSFSKQLKNYVLSSGFEAVIKPQSFVASSIANHHSKK